MEKVECTCCTQACKSANVAMRDSYMVDAYWDLRTAELGSLFWSGNVWGRRGVEVQGFSSGRGFIHLNRMLVGNCDSRGSREQISKPHNLNQTYKTYKSCRCTSKLLISTDLEDFKMASMFSSNQIWLAQKGLTCPLASAHHENARLSILRFSKGAGTFLERSRNDKLQSPLLPHPIFA